MAGTRFTAWFAEGERHSLHGLARRQGCSENYLVRVALRAFLYGEAPPQYLLDDLAHDSNPSNGGNDKNETAQTTR